MYHVGNVDFGDGISPYSTDSPIRDTFMHATVEDDYTAQLLLTEQYDQTYGIFDHDQYDAIDPLSTFGMHPAEDCFTGSRLKRLMRELIACRLPELTHTPVMELMQYPRWILDDLLEDARKAKLKEENITRELEQQMVDPVKHKNAGGA